jgi:thioredoxin
MRSVLFITVALALTCVLNCSSSRDTGSKIIHLTDAMFKEKVFDYVNNKTWKYQGKKPCVVDFYASWCGPCKMIAPIMEDLAKVYDKKIIIYKVDTQAENVLASSMGIQSIPTVLFCPLQGNPQVATGAMSRENYVKAIEEILLNKK